MKKKVSYIICISILFFAMLIFLRNINNSSLKLVIYTVTYLSLFGLQLYNDKFDLLKISSLFSVYHFIYIGGCPIFLAIQAFTFSNHNTLLKNIISSNLFLNKICYLILLSYYLFVITNMFISLYEDYKETREIQIDKKNSKLEYSKYLCIIMYISSIVFEIIYLLKNYKVLFGGDLENGRILAMSGNGIYLYGMWLGTFGLVLIYELVMRKKFQARYFWILCIFHIVTISLIGFRSRIISLIVMLILVHNKYRKINFKKVIRLGILLLLLASTLGVVRDMLSGSSTSIIKTIIRSLGNGGLNIYYIFEGVPNKIKLQYGNTYLINLKIFLPGPNDDFTIWLKKALELKFSGGGVTPTVLGESYINFGKFGVCSVFILISLITNYLNKKYKSSSNAYFWAFYIWILVSSVRGGFTNSEINFILFSVVNYFIYIIFNKNLRRNIKL